MSLFAFLVIRVFPGVCCYFLHLAADALGSMIARTEHFHPHLALAALALAALPISWAPQRQAGKRHYPMSLRHYATTLPDCPPAILPGFSRPGPTFRLASPTSHGSLSHWTGVKGPVTKRRRSGPVTLPLACVAAIRNDGMLDDAT